MAKDVLTEAPYLRAASAQSEASQNRSATRSESVAASARKPLKVCIIGLKCYDQMAGSPVLRYLGGIETHLALLAKGLQGDGCEVSLITYDHGQAAREVFDGVKVLKSYSPTGGIRRLRWFWRVARLWRAMKEADADIYLQTGAGDETGMVAAGCRAKFFPKRKFVFSLAHDMDCVRPIGATSRWEPQTLIYRFGIKRADLIISQTKTQQKNLEASMGFPSQVIRWTAKATEGSCGGPACANQVLWVGRIVPEKRTHWLLEMARRCPNITFHVAGSANNSSEYAAKFLADAKTLPNMRIHGSLARPQLNDLFRSCSLLCCTSESEGFPVTFSEVWSCGMPIVTTFDPDGIIERYGLGRAVKTIDELIANIQSLPTSDAYAGISNACRKFYQENQTVEAVSHRFHNAFRELLGA